MSTATSIASKLAPTMPAIPVVGTAIGAVLGVITAIFANHAQAVQEQGQLLCTLPPQINAMLQQIDQGLAAGTLAPSDAQQAYSGRSAR